MHTGTYPNAPVTLVVDPRDHEALSAFKKATDGRVCCLQAVGRLIRTNAVPEMMGMTGSKDWLTRCLEGMIRLQHVCVRSDRYATGLGLSELLKRLPRPANLRTVDLHGCKLVDEDLRALATLQNLHELKLSRCDGITDASASALSGLRQLKTLDIRAHTGITGWNFLTRLPKLETLHLNVRDNLTTDCLNALTAAMKNLRALSVQDCSRLTDEHWTKLAGLESLRMLSLDSGDAPDWTPLNQLENLEALELRFCETIRGGDLNALAELTNLRELKLESCEAITNAGVRALATLKKLQTRSFHSCSRVGDDGLTTV